MTATVTNYYCLGDVEFVWVGATVPWVARETAVQSTYSAASVVPVSFTLGRHRVLVRCSEPGSPDLVVGDFTVNGSPPVLDPATGPVGSMTTARVSGGCDGPVAFVWEGGATSWGQPVPVEGGYSVVGAVPASLTPGPHLLQASCSSIEGNDFIWEPAAFEVTSPQVSVEPPSGSAGSSLTARVEGSCEAPVTFVWDDDPDRAWPATSTRAGYSGSTTVPADLAPGPHTISASCGLVDGFVWQPTSFEVTLGRVALAPGTGSSGAEVTATGAGSCPEEVEVRWADSDEPWHVDTGASGFRATSRVPEGLDLGGHQVLATCGSDSWEGATFTVAPVPTPTLTVNPDTAPAGRTIRATARGFACRQVVFVWRDTSAATSSRVVDGTASAEVVVPTTFSSGEHLLDARCETGSGPSATQVFTVSPLATVSLALDPPSPEAGGTATVTAAGFPCPDVEMLWDGQGPAATVSVPASGAFTDEVTVPEDFSGGHTLVVRCITDPGTAATVAFTIPNGEASAVSPWWLVGGVLLAVTAASVTVALRRRPDEVWARVHARVVPGDRARHGISITESPADPRRPDVTVRLEPRVRPPTHVMKELAP